MKTILTYSSLQTFLNCQRRYYWRFVRELVLIGPEVVALWFGTIIHDALKLWYSEKVIETTEAPLSDLAHLMMQKYVETYPTENFSVIALEEEFEAPIINPRTKAKSRKYTFKGKTDGLVSEDGDTFILEHKTASMLTHDYLASLWTDFQTTLYAHYLAPIVGFPIHGAIYNVLLKPRSNIKDIEAWYVKDKRFHRELLLFGRADFKRTVQRVWDLTQALQFCERKNQWLQNTANCFNYNRQCPYYMICKSDDNPAIIENHYEYKPAHSELTQEADPETADML